MESLQSSLTTMWICQVAEIHSRISTSLPSTTEYIGAQECRAPAYDHWRKLFTAEKEPAAGALAGSEVRLRAGTAAGRAGRLSGRQIPLDGVAQLLEFERGGDLELWELWLEP